VWLVDVLLVAAMMGVLGLGVVGQGEVNRPSIFGGRLP